MTIRHLSALLVALAVLAGCDNDSPSDPSPGPVDVTLTPAATGSVRSDGFVFLAPNVGDTALDRAQQAFLRYDLSDLPDDATIDAISVDFSSHTTVGDPFAWGCVEAYSDNVFPLASSAYFGVAPAPANRLFSWCDAGELAAGALIADRLRTLAQTAVGAAIDLRLQFAHKVTMGARTNGDGTADQLQFGMPTLTITYTGSQ